MKYIINDNKISIFLQEEIYNMDVLHKCFYWYSGDYSISIIKEVDNEVRISLMANDKEQINFNIESLIEQISRDLIDYKLRDIIFKETKNIRELIVAKAFAHYDDNDPASEITDPVGFDVKSII